MATCDKHPDEIGDRGCLSCDNFQVVCSECLLNEHRGHQTETLKTMAQRILERLRLEKANTIPDFKQVKLDLNTCASVKENEQNLSGNTRRYIERRRDHLKRAVDEIADKLLDKNETSFNNIASIFDEFEFQVEDQVKKKLQFLNDFAHLEHSTDYRHIVDTAKNMTAPRMPRFRIPPKYRLTLKQVDTIDRSLIRKMFGEDVEEDIRTAYIPENTDQLQDLGQSHTDVTSSRSNSIEGKHGSVDFEIALANGQTLTTRQKSQKQSDSNYKTENTSGIPATDKLGGKDRDTTSHKTEDLPLDEVEAITHPQTSSVAPGPSIRKRNSRSKRSAKGFSLGEAKVLSDVLNVSPSTARIVRPTEFIPQENYDLIRPPRRAPKMLSLKQESVWSPSQLSATTAELPQGGNPTRRTTRTSQDEAGVILSTFQHSASTPTAMCPADSGHCWFIHNNASEIKLISNSGVVRKTVDVSGSKHLLGMSSVADGSLLICNPYMRCIKEVHHPDYHVFDVFHMAPLIPVAICVAPTGSIYLTMIDRWSYDQTSDSIRVLMKCDSKWKMTAEAQYSKHGGNLFVLPYRVCVSSNETLVVVINQTSKMSSHLMIFDMMFTLLLRCVGHENVILGDRSGIQASERFNIMDVKFDVMDNLVIIEGYTGTVQVLDPTTCRPLRILVREQGNPWTLAVYDRNIWVGFQDGRVKCLTY